MDYEWILDYERIMRKGRHLAVLLAASTAAAAMAAATCAPEAPACTHSPISRGLEGGDKAGLNSRCGQGEGRITEVTETNTQTSSDRGVPGCHGSGKRVLHRGVTRTSSTVGHRGVDATLECSDPVGAAAHRA